jgi:hypothetical protein
MKRELNRLPVSPQGQARDQSQTGGNVSIGFRVGGAREREFARRQPIARRRIGEPGLSVMTRDGRRRRCDLIGELLLQRPSDVGMFALATAPQQ